VLILFCSACQNISLQVPSYLQAEALVGKVNLKECFQSASLIQSSDPDFRILEDGSTYATHNLVLSSEKKSFSILLSDTQRQEQKEIEIVLEAGGRKIYAYATTVDGYAPEYTLPLLFKVEDDNDNASYFEDKVTVFSVPENCQTGTSVGKVTDIDLDEPDTLHTCLKYKILQQIPDNPKHFSVHPDIITTTTRLLDRERERKTHFGMFIEQSLNYEVHRQMVLQIGVLNEAQFSKAANSQTPTMCITTVTVKVKDHDEGPECQPPVKVIKSKDGLPWAQHSLDTKQWIRTMIIDHSPQIGKEVTICWHDKDFAVLKPVDQDGPDNGSPFQFILDNCASKLWTIETLTDGKTAILRELKNLDYNYYSVPLQIKDRHGVSAEHMLSVRVCDCTIPSECRMTTKVLRDARQSNAILGRWAILAMVLGSALLSCKYNYLECVS
ncbi:hypothetical protein EI555_007347, partial [Monodon monoceros]